MNPVFIATGAFGEPFATFGNIPQGMNQGGADMNFVPDGEVWVIHAASVGQSSTGSYPGVVCSLHIEQRLTPADGGGIHVFALMGMRPCAYGTPFLALDRPVVLLPGMRIGARFLAPPQGLSVSLMAYGFKYPIDQLAAVLHGQASVSQLPDYSALIAAAQAAAASLTTLAQSAS